MLCGQIENIKSFCSTARSNMYDARIPQTFQSPFAILQGKRFYFCTSSFSSSNKIKCYMIDSIDDGSIDSLKCSCDRKSELNARQKVYNCLLHGIFIYSIKLIFVGLKHLLKWSWTKDTLRKKRIIIKCAECWTTTLILYNGRHSFRQWLFSL